MSLKGHYLPIGGIGGVSALPLIATELPTAKRAALAPK